MTAGDSLDKLVAEARSRNMRHIDLGRNTSPVGLPDRPGHSFDLKEKLDNNLLLGLNLDSYLLWLRIHLVFGGCPSNCTNPGNK